jgi:excisionase family DNA binding protein
MENDNNRSQPALLRRREALLRRAEAWRALAIGPSTYKGLVANGELREVPIGKRGRRLPLSEVERYIAERLGK